MGKYFGTDGFRGEANKELTVEHAYKVGRFIGWYYGILKNGNNHSDRKEHCKIVLGKDTRRSSYMFEYALATGITASGGDAYLLHVTTTPSVSYVTRTGEFDCGIMISASHNPYYDNGIKLMNQNGEKMDDETISLIEAYIDGNLEYLYEKLYVTQENFSKINTLQTDISKAEEAQNNSFKIKFLQTKYFTKEALNEVFPNDDLPLANRNDIGSTVDYAAGRNRYMGYLISLATRSYRGMRVGLDCANGSSWMIARNVFDALGAKTYVINADPNGLNINEDAGSTHIEHLQEFVLENKLDVGFAFDGDADRCIAVDEKGNVVDGDLILYVYGRYMKERGKLLNNTVVTTIMSNFGLYKAFDELGISYEKTAVGDKYVYESMMEHGHRLGGEQSGHIIFSKYATTGDGILTALKLMEVILEKKTTLSRLVEPVTIYPQVLKNVRVKSKPEARGDEDVQAQVKKVAEALGDSGRILLRESGTEPVLRVMVEAETKRLCEQYANCIIEVLKKKGHVI